MIARFQFLPHYFKYIGLTLFIGYFIIEIYTGFRAGYEAGYKGRPSESRSINFLPNSLSYEIIEIIAYSGLLLYAFSRDKVFDEFIYKIRLESVCMIFFGSLFFILARKIIQGDWEMSASYLFEAQIILYLLINKIRKSANI